MPDLTPRLSLPCLAVGQAQKEITHNEALVLLDGLTQPVVVAVAPSAIPDSPLGGQGWIIGAGATGAWAGHDHALALWTEGGWRFVALPEGSLVWSLADGLPVRRTATGWRIGQVDAAALQIGGIQVVGERQPAISTPVGGTTIDQECRVALAAILSSLRTHGLIFP